MLVLIIGCTAQPYPTINCPVCNCPTQQPQQEYLHIYFIDVGQGDAILIKYNDTEMLIDCGNNGEGVKVADFLRSKGITTLEYLMMTHPDSDHIGGCDDVLKQFKTNAIINNGRETDTYTYKEVRDEVASQGIQSITAQQGMEWIIGPTKISVIQADNGLDDNNMNSIVAELTYNEVSALFTGDCDNQCETLLISRNITANILKVAHHGSKYATSTKLLGMLKPSTAIISVGDNSYGHPTQEVLDRLSQEGVITYRTDLNGNIDIRSDGRGYQVTTEK